MYMIIIIIICLWHKRAMGKNEPYFFFLCKQIIPNTWSEHNEILRVNTSKCYDSHTIYGLKLVENLSDYVYFFILNYK